MSSSLFTSHSQYITSHRWPDRRCLATVSAGHRQEATCPHRSARPATHAHVSHPEQLLVVVERDGRDGEVVAAVEHQRAGLVVLAVGAGVSAGAGAARARAAEQRILGGLQAVAVRAAGQATWEYSVVSSRTAAELEESSSVVTTLKAYRNLTRHTGNSPEAHRNSRGTVSAFRRSRVQIIPELS